MFVISAITVSEIVTKWYMRPLRMFVGFLLTTLLVLHRGGEGGQLILSFLMMLAAFLAGTLVGIIVRPPKQASNGSRDNQP
jgi:hypothetical protein